MCLQQFATMMFFLVGSSLLFASTTQAYRRPIPTNWDVGRYGSEITCSSDSGKWGNGCKAMIDDNRWTHWHQGPDKNPSVTITFRWPKPGSAPGDINRWKEHTVNEIVTISPMDHGNYNWRT